MRLKKDNDMGMRKATLLKLNGVEVGINVTQNALLNVLDKGLQLGIEDTHHQVRAIRSRLAIKKCTLNLRPGRISSHGDKEIPTTIVVIDGQGILKMLLHVMCAPREARRQDESFSQLIHTGISIGSHGIH